METKKDNLNVVSPGVAKLQGFASGNFGCVGSIEYLAARKYIGFRVVSMNVDNDVVIDIVWGQESKR